MSICFGCYFHRSDFMENGCDYFEEENYYEPNWCHAFSLDGRISEEAEEKIFEETNGVFGKRRQEHEID